MKTRSDRRGKTIVGWFLLLFLVSQFAVNAYLEVQYPQLIDPEYSQRLTFLRRRLAEKDDGRTLLVMGSSRTVMSFCPEILPPLEDADGRSVTVFNFSHIAAGPMLNLVELNRLLRDGHTPTWLVMELMAPQMNDRRQSIVIRGCRAVDLPTLQRHYPPLRLLGSLISNRICPCYRYREFLLHEIHPALAPQALSAHEMVQIGPLGGDVSYRLKDAVDESTRRQEIDKAKVGYYPNVQNLRMRDLSTSAMREILTVCRERNIRLVLLLTPEGPAFRSWYSAASEKTFADYCRNLQEEFQVPIVSARDWLEEVDFIDSHHVLRPGAEKFTRRLATEVLEPLVRNRPVPSLENAPPPLRQARQPSASSNRS